MTTTDQPTEPVNSTKLRLARTPGDMAKAVLVLLVPVMVLVVVYVYFFGGSKPITVDPSPAFADARADGAFTVLAPSGLSESWKPISAAYDNGEPATLRIGYVTPSGAGIQLVESTAGQSTVLRGAIGSAPSSGLTYTVGGATWVLLSSTTNADKALLDTHAGKGRTIVVAGDAGVDELRTFAASLH